MAQRICPNCGHMENEYTFFCTECGGKTVVGNDVAEEKKDNHPTVKPLIQPQSSHDLNAEFNNQIVENNFETDSFTLEVEETIVSAEEDNCDGSTNAQPTDVITHVKEEKEVARHSGFEWKKHYTYVVVAGIILTIVIAVLVNINKSSDETMSYADNSYDEDFADKEIDYEDYEEEDYENELSNINETVDAEEENAYILPGSDSRYIDKNELNDLSAEECRLARNELYARHGRRFDDEALQAYFDSKDWYEGVIDPADFSEDMLNEYEVYNRDLIVEYEEDEGYR